VSSPQAAETMKDGLGLDFDRAPVFVEAVLVQQDVGVNVETGEIRSQAIVNVTAKALRCRAMVENVNMGISRLITDEAKEYTVMDPEFVSHDTVNHSLREYARGPVTINQAENYFSQLKRSISRTHDAISKQTLESLPGRVRLPVLHPQDHRHGADGAIGRPYRWRAGELQADQAMRSVVDWS
jgi:hypothetical protein